MSRQHLMRRKVFENELSCLLLNVVFVRMFHILKGLPSLP